MARNWLCHVWRSCVNICESLIYTFPYWNFCTQSHSLISLRIITEESKADGSYSKLSLLVSRAEGYDTHFYCYFLKLEHFLLYAGDDLISINEPYKASKVIKSQNKHSGGSWNLQDFMAFLKDYINSNNCWEEASYLQIIEVLLIIKGEFSVSFTFLYTIFILLQFTIDCF